MRHAYVIAISIGTFQFRKNPQKNSGEIVCLAESTQLKVGHSSSRESPDQRYQV